MVMTTNYFIYDSPNVPMTSTAVKKPSASKSLCLFTNILNVKNKTKKYRVGDAESKRRSMKVGNRLWTNKTKRKGYSKINEYIKCNMYAWITPHTQVVQSPIYYDCLKIMFDYQTKTQLVPKLLIHVSVR